jgi:hypothetical protein
MRSNTTFRSLSIFGLALALGVMLIGLPGGVGAQGPDDGIGAQAALGTAFTYQGRLDNTNGPVNGTCDFTFELYDAAGSGEPPTGGTLLGTDTRTGVQANDGYFSVELDFGANAFTGDARWLEITVNCGSGDAALSPRQPLTAAPYALHSLGAPWSGLTGVPAGFDDDVDDDTLAGLSCANDQVAEWNGSAWVCGGGDHGALSGLGDDDHPQYFNLSQNETVTGRPAFNGGTSGSTSPFTVDSNYRVTSLNADQLDGQHASAFASDSHNHWGESWSGSGTGLSLSGGSTGLYGSGSSRGIHGHSWSGVALYARTDSGNGNIIEAWSSGMDRVFYVERGGDVRAAGPFIDGGADYAELLSGVVGLEPTDVLVIGPDGQLTRSTQPYQASVAGVYSTAPGFLAGAGDEDADITDKVPLAIMGVVPVKATAENGSIQSGDLLTTSSIPGHAMKASPVTVDGLTFYPSGVIVGKGLEGLDEGTGVIEMLVVLQ